MKENEKTENGEDSTKRNMIQENGRWRFELTLLKYDKLPLILCHMNRYLYKLCAKALGFNSYTCN